MSNLISEVKRQQKEIQNLQKEAERRSGKKEQLLKQLKIEFQVTNKTEAEDLLKCYKEEKNETSEKIEKINMELEEILSSAKAGTTS